MPKFSAAVLSELQACAAFNSSYALSNLLELLAHGVPPQFQGDRADYERFISCRQMDAAWVAKKARRAMRLR